MWIWAAMLDLKLHVLHGKEFHIIRGPLLIPILLVIAAITAASFYLNAVFAFAISEPGHAADPPGVRPGPRAPATDPVVGIRDRGWPSGSPRWSSQRWGKGWYRAHARASWWE